MGTQVWNKTCLNSLPSPIGKTREELHHIVLSEEYGFLPDAPFSIEADVISRDEIFCAGKAFLERIILTCHTKYGDFTFPLNFTCPVGQNEPVPCVVHINFRDLVPDKYELSEEIVDEGYAVLSFCYENISSDNGDFTNGLAGLVYPQGTRQPDDCGKIGLWAWAASRVMDYALTRTEINHSRISVAGHSRLGKTALLTGALDERFYCAYSNDSGCSGAAITRGKRGESIRKIYEVFGYWFCENYGRHIDREEEMEFDQHYLLSAIAPRHTYIGSAVEDIWADPDKEYECCVAASVYYENLGQKGFVHPDRLPEAEEQFAEGTIGYHLRFGKHYFSRRDWQLFLRYLKEAD